MALKPDRMIDPYGDEINLTFTPNADVEAGTFLCYGTTPGSGDAIQDEHAGNLQVLAAPTTSSRCAGMLVTPFVVLDETKYPRNNYKVSQRPGDKAHLSRRGWYVTNMLASGGVTPDAGKKMYLGPNGKVTDGATGPLIGEFMSRVNESGYCRIFVNVPPGA